MVAAATSIKLSQRQWPIHNGLQKILHRIDPQVVKSAFGESCFILKGEAGFLGNSEDNHTLAVFDKSIRGNSDRFVFKFVRN